MDKLKFEILVNKYSKRIFNYLLKIMRNREDSEDILQDVFAAFYQKVDSVNENSYLSYLYQTAYHKALNKISGRKRTRKILEKVKNESASNLEDIPDNNEVIKTAFQKLNHQDALLLELQFFQKLSYKEIADILETTASAIDSRLVRAKKKLKNILAQEIRQKEVTNYRGDNYEQKIRL